jgi:hypothetical protein
MCSAAYEYRLGETLVVKIAATNITPLRSREGHGRLVSGLASLLNFKSRLQ